MEANVRKRGDLLPRIWKIELTSAKFDFAIRPVPGPGEVDVAIGVLQHCARPFGEFLPQQSLWFRGEAEFDGLVALELDHVRTRGRVQRNRQAAMGDRHRRSVARDDKVGEDHIVRTAVQIELKVERYLTGNAGSGALQRRN